MAEPEILHLKVKAGAASNCFAGQIEIDGITYYKLHITTSPEDGKANKYIIKFLAKTLKIAQQDITIISGSKSSFKKLSIKNIDPSYLNSQLKHYI